METFPEVSSAYKVNGRFWMTFPPALMHQGFGKLIFLCWFLLNSVKNSQFLISNSTIKITKWNQIKKYHKLHCHILQTNFFNEFESEDKDCGTDLCWWLEDLGHQTEYLGNFQFDHSLIVEDIFFKSWWNTLSMKFRIKKVEKIGMNSLFDCNWAGSNV